MESVIRTAIEDALSALNLEVADFTVEHPKEMAHGDYATNVALTAVKKAGGNPRELAEKIIAEIEDEIEYVESVDIAGPGFINFHLSRDFFTGEIDRTRTERDNWGKHDAWEGKTVVVEYTDPNPFKEFHVGHLFTNSVGESIARLFMFAGADTKRVNYQGDVGMHVAHAVWGMRRMGFTADSDFTARDLGKAYALGATAYKEDEAAALEMKEVNKALYERGNSELNTLYDKGREISLKYFETIYDIIDTKFDKYFFESEAAPIGKELVLAYPEVFKESDGAYVFKGEEYGLHTRVFLNSEGLPTYEAKELALAKLKDDVFQYDYSVISTANEISEYFKVLKKAMSFVYPELEAKTEHVGHGMVRLAEGKMSSRTGNVIAAIDFINEIADAAEAKMKETGAMTDRKLAQEIAVGAIKYATLRSSIGQDTIFNKEQALSFEGDSGPYLQYTHARIVSVLAKAKEAGIELSLKNVPEKPYEIERVLYRFPEVVKNALQERQPHLVTTYLTELAGAFNTFYGVERIADKEDEFASYKAAIAEAVKITLKNGLWVLGIKAPEKM
jgi:arginyl-tRNA synthetase